MENCIFCKIVKGKSPSYKVYEDDKYIGLLDIFPASKGHVLLITKKHYRWVHDVDDFGDYWEKALKIYKALEKSMSPKWIQYLTHGLIPHAHIHIIPRYDEVAANMVLPNQGRLKLSDKEFIEVVEKIKSAF